MTSLPSTVASASFMPAPLAELFVANGGFGVVNDYTGSPNAAIGLALVNIGAAIPGTGDMATQGTPAKFTFCVAENEAASPWEPLHVERGFPKDATTVTVIAAEGPHNINDHESLTAEGILTMMAGTMTITGSNNAYYAGQPCVAFGPEHAQTVAGDGMSKADVKHGCSSTRRCRWAASRRRASSAASAASSPSSTEAPLDAPVRMAQSAEDSDHRHRRRGQALGVHTDVRQHAAVTRALKRADGSLAQTSRISAYGHCEERRDEAISLRTCATGLPRRCAPRDDHHTEPLMNTPTLRTRTLRIGAGASYAGDRVEPATLLAAQRQARLSRVRDARRAHHRARAAASG